MESHSLRKIRVIYMEVKKKEKNHFILLYNIKFWFK